MALTSGMKAVSSVRKISQYGLSQTLRQLNNFYKTNHRIQATPDVNTLSFIFDVFNNSVLLEHCPVSRGVFCSAFRNRIVDRPQWEMVQ